MTSSRVLANVDGVVAILRRGGIRFFSPWWREFVMRFLGGKWKRAVLRVGRRGGKSMIGAFMAVMEMLYGEHDVPKGNVGWFAFLSVDRAEASQRIRMIKTMLDVLGIKYVATVDTIELLGRNRGARVFTSSIAGGAGFDCIGIWFDEMAKQPDDPKSAEPATEVLAGIVPSTATYPNARTWLVSSPMASLDAHAKAFDEGDTDHQLTAWAPTWIANPSLTEAETHALEKNPRVWAREYNAIPSSARADAFDADAIAAAYLRPWPTRTNTVCDSTKVIYIDPSSGRSDTWAWMVAFWRGAHFIVELVDGIEGSFWRQIPGDKVVERVAIVAKEYEIRSVHSDQRESLMLESEFSKRNLAFTSWPWTNVRKVTAVETIRRWLRDGVLILPKHERMKRELLAFEESITPSGTITFAGRKSGDDYVALLITAAIADAEGGTSRPSAGGETTWGFEPDSRWSGMPGRGF